MLSLLLPACALMDTYIEAPGVAVEPRATSRARIAGTSFIVSGGGTYLRGRVVPRATNRMPLFGHIDIEITGPGDSDTACVTARHSSFPRRIVRSFYARLPAMPTPGSVVRVWHHDSAMHSGCKV